MRQYNPIYPSIRKIQSEDAVKVNWVQLNKNPTQNQVIKGEKFVIQVIVAPSNALNKRLSWTYSPIDGSLNISSTDRNHQRVTIIADHAGIYYITCATTDGSNIQNTIQLMVSNSEGEDFEPITSFSWYVEQQSEDMESSSRYFNTVESDNPITLTFSCNPSTATWKTYEYDFHFTGEDASNSYGYSSENGNYEGTLPDGFNVDNSKPEQIKITMPGNLIGTAEITLKALDGSSVVETFTGAIEKAYVAIEDVTLEVVDNITECDVGDTITCIITVIPANATEFINGQLQIAYTTSIDTSHELIYKQDAGTWTYKFSPQESGNLIIKWTATSEGISGFSKQLQTHIIKVGKVITPMTDSELTAHLEKRRYENLISSSHFESIEQLASFVAEKDFHDIYIGDYFELNLPWIYYDEDYRRVYTTSLSAQTKLRIVDINYLSDKNAGITQNHLVLMPDTLIGSGPMTDPVNGYQNEIVQISSSDYWGQTGRGYYNNYMINEMLPVILQNIQNRMGSASSHLLSWTDQVPVYYSTSYWGGYLSNVTYMTMNNVYMRQPNLIALGYTSGTDKNSIWNIEFRLFKTNREYVEKEAPSGATDSFDGILLTDLMSLSSGSSYFSTLQQLWYTKQQGSSGTSWRDTSIGPICPIMIFG